jgi:anthranilate synthase component 1
MKSLLTDALAGKSRRLQVAMIELPADLETPVSAYLKLKDHGARVLLESVESGTILGRFSFIGMMPESTLALSAEGLTVSNGSLGVTLPHEKPGSPLDSLKQVLSRISIDAPESHPRLLGGAVGFISYDLVRLFERIPELTSDVLGMPLALFYFIDTLVVFDHVQRRLRIISLTDDPKGEAVRHKLEQMREQLRAPLKLVQRHGPLQMGNGFASNLTKDQFCNAVRSAQEHIKAGDVYQLVVSQRFTGRTEADPFLIYRALRMLNPSPYMFYLDFDDTKLIGSSPEALVRLDSGMATVRPIAGTRHRGKDEEEDRQLAEQLIADEKERAEHVMLVDLGRNDLGRCCDIGSVKVTEFMKIEKYSHVMHMTSNVVGKLSPGMDQFDLFKATFPAGTVTGAPKIRSMQIIEELENVRRGPYAGAVGYFGLSGDMDWCIAIRTIICRGGEYHLQAGAGIVADSVPEREHQESIDKMTALKRAIELAEEGF